MRPLLAGAALYAFALLAALGRGATAPAGEIVFVSDRATANPGEVYALAVGKKPRDVTNTPATETDLAVSPRGGLLAYWSNRSGVWQMFVSHGDGSGARAVLTPDGSPSPIGPPQFTLDGRRLLVVMQLQSGSGQAFAVDVRSASGRRVGRPCAGGLSWSPDGRVLACAVRARVREVDVSTGQTLADVPGGGAIWSSEGRLAIVRTSSTTVTDERGRIVAYVRGSAGGWSPNGRLLAVTSKASLSVVEPGVRILLTVASPGYWFAFTGDSRRLAYETTNGFRLASLDGGPSRPLRDGYGTWSPDGRYAFVRFVKPHAVLIEVADELDRHAATVGHFDYDDHGDSRLVWAPGGRLYYEWAVRSHHDLWSVRADGSGLRRLTATGNEITGPAWSRDGWRLAYASAEFSGGLAGYSLPKVVVANAAGRAQSTIQTGNEGFAPSWSPDGAHLVVANGFGGELDVVRTDGLGRRRIAANGRSPAWSPNGSTIAYCAGDGVHTVGPSGAGDRVLVTASPGLEPAAVGWSPDGTQLAFTTDKGVYATAADGTGTPRLVRAAAGARGVSFSSDGSWLIYAATAPTGLPQRDLFIVAFDGSGFRALAPSPYDDGDPAWRPAP